MIISRKLREGKEFLSEDFMESTASLLDNYGWDLKRGDFHNNEDGTFFNIEASKGRARIDLNQSIGILRVSVKTLDASIKIGGTTVGVVTFSCKLNANELEDLLRRGFDDVSKYCEIYLKRSSTSIYSNLYDYSKDKIDDNLDKFLSEVKKDLSSAGLL